MNTQSLKFLYTRIKNPNLTKEQTESKVCQEILISLIGNNEEISKRVAFKGGVVIDSLAKGKRGYTKDIDFDFIKYPLSDEGINKFFNQINESNFCPNIMVNPTLISDLRHKNYLGKRVLLKFSDGESSFFLTVDIGVYVPLFKKNSLLDYELKFGNKTNITVNPVERIIAEKLSTFAIYGTDNTRTKDLFDAYFLLDSFDFDSGCVAKMLNKLLVSKGHYYKTFEQAIQSIANTLNDKSYKKELEYSDKNWIGKPVESIINSVQSLLLSLRNKKAFKTKAILNYKFLK